MDSNSFNALYGDYRNLHQLRFEDTLRLLARHDGQLPRTGKRLLDVGIFPGFMAALAQDRGYDVWGIANEEMTPEFRAFANARGFTLAQLDVETDPFPFAADFFDAVLCTEIIEHMYRNPFLLIEKCFRVLKPGGLLVLSTPNLCRLPVLRALKQGHSYMPPMDGPLDESFPVNPCYTHRREYTMREIVYLTCEQDRHLYQFAERERFFSRCWDQGLRTRLKGERKLAQIVRAAYDWLAIRNRPELRSCLMLLVRKPEICERIPADTFQDPAGLHAVEVDTDTASMSRRPLPTSFRWTNGRCTFSVPNPCQGCKRPLQLRIQYAYVVPGAVPETQVTFSVAGHAVSKRTLSAEKTYRVATLPIRADQLREARIPVEIASPTWSPEAFGFPDDRQLGVMLSWGDALLMSTSER
jgi:SAM-dependent methyltransferase